MPPSLQVIGLLDVFTPAAALEEFNELWVFRPFKLRALFHLSRAEFSFWFCSYLVTNLMGADLNNIVKFQRLSDEHVQFLIYQLLRGLKVISLCENLEKINFCSDNNY